jgi:hypothetical protein
LTQLIHAIVDHYRCPDAVAAFALSGRPGGDPGFFRFGRDTICFGSATLSSGGSLSDASTGPLYDVLDDVAVGCGSVSLPFDPNEIVDNLRCERYRANGHGRTGVGGGSMIRSLYYGLRPFLTLPIRRHIQRAYLNGWKDISFPRWPVDTTVEQCLERLLALSMKAHGVERVPFIWFWPDRAMSCAIMTHDVEHLSGRNFCSQLMDLDDAAQVASAFQIVPEGRYAVPDSFLDEIRSRGFEINVHDLNHDGRLFARRDDFLRAVERINEYGRRFRAAGFRSGALYRNQAWFDALDFSYDMSVPSVAHLDPQRGGCCTVMPFFIGKILELPVTTIQDYTLFHILNDYSLDVWKQQLDAITRRHGLASVIVHPDYVIEQRARTAYQRLLEHLARLRDERQMWIALPHEVDRWWRERRAMSIVPDGTGWRIEGPNRERARIAFANLVGDTLVFSFDDAAPVQEAILAESLMAH